jgi:4-diphosphocytidyl-2-C-methyl-D-erythritol kinase
MQIFFSPAKLNLFLRILGKRADGYHELASLFQAVSLGDTLAVAIDSSAAGDTLTAEGRPIAVDSSNLILRALAVFRKYSPNTPYLRIHLTKNIPLEAGLGGGSSNAATALWAVNQLTDNRYSSEQLKEWGKELGADVPFFFSSGTAYCTGRGDQITAQAPLQQKKPVCLVIPPYGLSTPAVYGAYRSDVVPQRELPGLFEASYTDQQPSYFNDLQQAANTVNPMQDVIQRQLATAGFEVVVMTGSGSAFFCIGNGAVSLPPGYELLPVNYLSRTEDGWYSQPFPYS